MAEISDAALAELQQAHQLLKSLYDDSAVGFDFRKMVKKKFPNASIPELQALEKTEELGTGLEKKFEEMKTAATKKIDDFLEERRKEKEQAQVDAFAERFEKIVKERGYTKEGREKVLQLMKDDGIQNPEHAVLIFEANQPKPDPKPREFSSRMSFISPDDKDDANFKKLMEDPDQFMVDEMLASFDESARNKQ